MTPIKDCEYSQEDGCCGHPDAPTPECHIAACPRLAWFVEALLIRSDKLCSILSDFYGDDMPAEIVLPLIELEHAIKASEEAQ